MTSNRKLTLGVATFDRLEYIKKMSQSLQESVNLNDINVRVYDDKSLEVKKSDLWEIFPFARDIVVRELNLKADKNMYTIYKNFLETRDDIFVNADSDIIFRPNWLEMINEYLSQTDGLLSLYNSNQHQFIDMPVNGWGVKSTLGAAGVVMTREIVEMIINNIPEEKVKGFDWQWSSLLQKKGVKLACLEDSYIQHIGIRGQNSTGMIHNFDYGLNFLPINEKNQEIMMEFLEEVIIESNIYVSNFSEENKIFLDFISKNGILDYKLGNFLLKIPRIIKKKINSYIDY